MGLGSGLAGMGAGAAAGSAGGWIGAGLGAVGGFLAGLFGGGGGSSQKAPPSFPTLQGSGFQPPVPQYNQPQLNMPNLQPNPDLYDLSSYPGSAKRQALLKYLQPQGEQQGAPPSDNWAL